MSRIIFLLIVFGIVIASYFAIRGYKDTYKILPAQLPKELPTPPKFEDWHEFTSPAGKFSVLLPVLPQHATEKIKDPKTNSTRKYNMFVSEKLNGTIFMISLIDFMTQFNPQQAEAALTSIMNDLLASNPNNRLKYSESGDFDGHKALNFVIENNEIIIEGKTFLIGNTLYVLTRISQVEDENDEEFQFFLNSFHLLPNDKDVKQTTKPE